VNDSLTVCYSSITKKSFIFVVINVHAIPQHIFHAHINLKLPAQKTCIHITLFLFSFVDNLTFRICDLPDKQNMCPIYKKQVITAYEGV